MKWIWRLVACPSIVCAWFVIAGCESSGDRSGPLLYSSSFSPITAKTSDGKVGTPRWVYRINGGQPLATTESGLAMSIALSNLTLTIDPSTLQRAGQFSGSIRGDVTGAVDARFDETLRADANRTLVQSQVIKMDMNMRDGNENIDISIDLRVRAASPVEWFLDRDNLDRLPIGYVHEDRGVRATVSGTVAITGFGSDAIPSTSAVYDERWTVRERKDRLVVGGREYRNLVRVDRQTVIPDVGVAEADAERVTISYWVAKGVGMVRGTGQYRIFGQPLTVELIDTNMSAP